MLSDQQRLVLTIIGQDGKGTPTPINITRTMVNEHGRTDATWQGVTRTVASLVRRGLVRRVRLPKMTYYTITEDGQQELAGNRQGQMTMTWIVVVTAADGTVSAAGPFTDETAADGFAARIALASSGEYGGIAVPLDNPAEFSNLVGA